MTTAIELKANIVPSEIFKPFQKQIDAFEEINEKTVFDYEDAKGNKEARSHVSNLRKVKTPIKAAHKEAKAEALQIGRALDAYKNKLVEQVDEMIGVHAEPLQRIKDRQEAEEEAARVSEEMSRAHDEALGMHDLFKREESMKKQQAEMEAKQAEFDRIAKEQKEKQEQIDRDEKIKKEASEKAEKQAEIDRLEAERKLEEEKNRRIREAELAEEKRLADIAHAEKEKQDIIDKLERESQKNIERLKREQKERDDAEEKRLADEKAEADRLQKIKDDRQADVDHRKKVNTGIVKFLMQWHKEKNDCQEIVEAIVKGQIPGLSVNY